MSNIWTGTLKVPTVNIVPILLCPELVNFLYYILLIALSASILDFSCLPPFFHAILISSIFTILIFIAYMST